MTQDEVKQHTPEEGEGQEYAKNSSRKWRRSFSGVGHRLFSMYWSDFSMGSVFLFLSIIVAFTMNNRKGAIYALAAGISLFVTIVAFTIAYHVANQEPVVSESSTAPLEQDGKSPESIPTRAPKTSIQGDQVMPDENPKKPRTSQKANNTAGNVYQSGRDTHVYNAPPPAPPKSEYELTTSDRIAMVKLLAPYAGQMISLVKWTDYPEILIYAQQIEQVFAAAGWQIHYVHIGGKARYYGLILGVSDTQHLSAAANAILLAFGKIGVRVPVESINNVSPYRAEGVIALAIGAQP